MAKPNLYGHRWRKASKTFLMHRPLCIECSRLGRVTASQVVDHIVPHRGDIKLFWDTDNWQPLCKLCHDSHKQRLEKSGRAIGNDVKGIPLDPNHHWNK